MVAQNIEQVVVIKLQLSTTSKLEDLPILSCLERPLSLYVASFQNCGSSILCFQIQSFEGFPVVKAKPS